ncbi:MAG: DNA-directed RNA polymerase subunit D [Candidatus Bathyarchaeota archaeon]|nr:DNA-directed RNA polymerase subunit D [Candidatus Bathyarchaeota archaeon]MDH5494763.1 DNA-directed RNA polymerase subunit D [Candidatus Bathyarchaeota archaeon]
MKIQILEKNDVSLRLLIEGTNTAFMNTLRRIILSEVPTMAMDDVVIIENSSPLQDEFLAHRIGLIPLKTDLDTYNLPENCTCKSEFGCNLCRASLVLEAEAEDHIINVYSGDFKSENPSIVPVSNKIPIAKLAPGQKIRLEAYARLGKGKDHARWQPVSMCAYKYVPIITIDTKLCNLCSDCIKVCPKNILIKAGNKIEIRNIENCTICQDCVDACPKKPKAIEVTWDETSFVFGIESTGALSTERTLREAFNILEGKLKDFLNQLTVKKDEKRTA